MMMMMVMVVVADVGPWSDECVYAVRARRARLNSV